MDMQQKNEGIDSFRKSLASLDVCFTEVSELFRQNSLAETTLLRDRLQTLQNKTKDDIILASKTVQEALQNLQFSLENLLTTEINALDEIILRIEPPSKPEKTPEVLSLKEFPQ